MTNINPRVDLAFKKIFGVEENKDLLISLINSIVSDEDKVEDVTLLNPYNLQSFRNDKLSILDIKARGAGGERFNIEIQISDEADYDKRALYYWAKLYTEQLKITQDYSTLSKAIGIHILNFTSIPNSDKYHNEFHITEKETSVEYFKDLELHTIELKKFTDNPNEELPDLIAKVKSSLDIWITFLTRHDLLNKDNLPKELNDDNLKKALGVLEVMHFSNEERMAYDDHLKYLQMEASSIRKAAADARQEGREEGREEGGQKRAMSMAKKMLSKGKHIDEIIEFTDLTKEQIESL